MLANKSEITSRALHENWKLHATKAGEFLKPNENIVFTKTAMVPGTVACAQDDHTIERKNYDQYDWWYETKFEYEKEDNTWAKLRFEGLATLAEVWLNGELILNSSNMFRTYVCDVEKYLKKNNVLTIKFRSLEAELAIKKPRGRWKSGLVTNQNLRYFRTTLLGRITEWANLNQTVGPWRGVFLESGKVDQAQNINVSTSFTDSKFKVDLSFDLNNENKRIKNIEFKIGENHFLIDVDSVKSNARFQQTFELSDAELWYPHTHGKQKLYKAVLKIKTESSESIYNLGNYGFRTFEFCRDNGKVEFLVNGLSVFCRGACYTVNDIYNLDGSLDKLKKSLTLAKEMGMNMVRVGGTMIYQSDEFYSLCDELGILVWQDFMFANLDYPITDENFKSEIAAEVRCQLERFKKHPSIAVYCGGSEVQQQAAMLGLPREMWSNEFFDSTIPKLISEIHTGVPYFPSSPCEGTLPFHVGTGIGHYYGVGAYRKPLQDVRNSNVKFTPECLGFSNVPDAENFELLSSAVILPTHHPKWKAGVPRDAGAGWDFEDIRDHYFKELFGIDAFVVRSADLNRYYQLSRLVSGHMMKSVFNEWRSESSLCGGGLVWFYNDLYPGAGWGILDSQVNPKAAYFDLKRSFATRGVFITDHGVDGLMLTVINESDKDENVSVGVEAYHLNRVRVANGEKSLRIPARGKVSINAEEVLGYFFDLNYSYRFGAKKHEVVRATLKLTDSKELIGEDFYFPTGINSQYQATNGIVAELKMNNRDEGVIQIKSELFLQSVKITVKNFKVEDNYFHLAPENCKTIKISRVAEGTKVVKVEIEAVNILDSVILRAEVEEKK